MPQNWKILNQYDFNLLPGHPTLLKDGDWSYYQYLNRRWQETGKNVLAVSWLLRNFPKGLSLEEPFGGCGVFSVALQNVIQPTRHVVSEIDDQCLNQLNHVLAGRPGVQILKEDAHVSMGTRASDLYVCDFPFFTLMKFKDGIWKPETERLLAQKPKAVVVTDGSSFLWHFVWKTLAKRGYPATSDRKSYAEIFNTFIRDRYGYHVTGLAYHTTCFYLRLEPQAAEIEYYEIAAGQGPNGLRPT